MQGRTYNAKNRLLVEQGYHIFRLELKPAYKASGFKAI